MEEKGQKWSVYMEEVQLAKKLGPGGVTVAQAYPPWSLLPGAVDELPNELNLHL